MTGWTRLAHPAFLVCVLVLAASAAGLRAALNFFEVHLQKEAIYAPERRQVSAVPAETASWKRLGDDQIESAEMVDELGTTNYLSRTYIEKDPPADRPARVLSLHLAYYTGMIDTVPHVPERCLVGGGLQIGRAYGVVDLPLDRSTWLEDREASREFGGRIWTDRTALQWSDAPGIRVRLPESVERLGLRTTAFHHPTNGQHLLAGYFFLANGSVARSAEEVRLLAFALQSHYAYYLKVQVSSASVSSAEELAEAGASLLGELMAEIMRCVPDWVEVRRGSYPPSAEGPAS